MKKIIFFLTIFTFINNCSFDNKTGIWKEENKISKITLKKNDNLKPVFEKNQTIEKEVVNSSNIDITISKPLKNKNWLQQNLINNNNIPNLFYTDRKLLINRFFRIHF